jgi:hypothetical protein
MEELRHRIAEIVELGGSPMAVADSILSIPEIREALAAQKARGPNRLDNTSRQPEG